MTETQTNTFLALDQAYTSGNTPVTKRVEAILFPEKVELPSKLQTVLDNLGDTPIAEPVLASAFEEKGLEGLSDELSKLIDLDGFDILSVGVFTFRAKSKIMDLTDKDGVYKSTPNTENMALPKISAVKELVDMLRGGATHEQLSDKAFLMTGLKKKGLSDWEIQLVGTLVTAFSTSYLDSLRSGATDRTPFGKYLKN